MKGVRDGVRPRGRLSGDVGDIYSLIGAVIQILEGEGFNVESEEFVRRAVELPNYDAVLGLSHDYVQFHNGE